MASNTVEATLRSRFEDGVTRAVEHTERVIAQAFSSMKNAGGVLNSGMSTVWNSVLGGLENYRQRLNQAAEESDSRFGKMGLGAAAFSVLLITSLAKAAVAVTHFIFELAKESSQAFETRNAFDSLTQSMNVQADLLLGKLKQATEGQIGGTLLMQNANRILQSHIPLTTDMYAKLVGNIFALAKASGVDGAQAVQTLTDGLIRGRASGLQSIGMHIAIKDAVTAMAEAQGGSAARLADESKLRVFYNELLEKTTRSVAALGPQFISIEDILIQSQVTWKGFLGSIGQAISRSGTLQGLLEKLTEALTGMGAGRAQLDEMTLATNRFITSFLMGMAQVANTLSAAVTVWNVIWATIKVAFYTGSSVIIVAVGAVHEVLTRFFEVLAMIPGADKIGLTKLASDMRALSNLLVSSLEANIRDITHAYDGVSGGAAQKLDEFAAAAARTAGQLSVLEGTILRASKGVRENGNDTEDFTDKLKKLNQQFAKYSEMRRELLGRAGNPVAAATAQLFEDFAKIDRELTLQGAEWDARRNALKVQALLAYDAKLREIEAKRLADQKALDDEGDRIAAESWKHRADGTEKLAEVVTEQLDHQRKVEEAWQRAVEEGAKRREEIRRKEVSDALSAASNIESALDLARNRRLSDRTAAQVLSTTPQTIAALQRQLDQLRQKPILKAEQVSEVLKLEEAIKRLNHLNLSPFQQTLQTVRDQVSQFAVQATESFATFFSEIVSGQEGAGKRLLAAFISMIGQVLIHMGTILIQTGIAEIALAHTLVGRLMGASVAAGAKAIAVGVILAATGGILQGGAANLTESSQPGGASSPQQPVQQARPNQVQVINVAAPFGPQTPGQARQNQEPMELRLKLEVDEGIVVRHVEKNIRNNGRLRTVVQNV